MICWGGEERDGDNGLDVMEASVWSTGWVENGGFGWADAAGEKMAHWVSAGAALGPVLVRVRLGIGWRASERFWGWGGIT